MHYLYRGSGTGSACVNWMAWSWSGVSLTSAGSTLCLVRTGACPLPGLVQWWPFANGQSYGFTELKGWVSPPPFEPSFIF